jgi:acyl-homoserine-lactone acylase
MLSSLAKAQFDVSKIDIVRDKWGVPHIFANTDAEVAYGLAYAHAEDDFETIQTSFLAGKTMLGRLKGKDGAPIDYVVHLLRIPELVNAKYETDISPEYKKVLEGYCAGFNAYAKNHPKDVLVKQLLPLTPKDMLCYSVLQLCVSSGADEALKSIFGGTVAALNNLTPGGSNAFAFNSKMTADGQVYLDINSHQPWEGPVSWYEAHLCSNEGWNIIGALFPGAPSILHGCNEYLGWAHTVNNPDKLDIYQLETNPKNKLQYKFDGAWQQLEQFKVHLNVKIAGIVIGLNKDAYWCKYGPAVITKKGVFAIRTPAMFDIRGLEEWYMLNKAQNFTQFRHVLDMGAIPGYNIVYADRYDTLYYLSNGKIPMRDKAFNWKTTLPGNTSKTLWTDIHPISDLPQVLQPAAGYVFNTNNTPFDATAAPYNFPLQGYDETMGYEKFENNRSLRFNELVKQYSKIGYDDFKRIKYDLQLPAKLAYTVNTDTLFLLNPQLHPEVADVVKLLQQWNRKADVNSTGATLFAVIYYYVVNELQNGKQYSTISTVKATELFKYARNYLLQNFKKTNVPLGDYQKLVRGNKTLPLQGIPDVIAAIYSVPYKNGTVRAAQGESYIELVRFTKDGPQIESVNCYGASNNPGSPHYADQADMFTQQKTKHMTLDKAEVYKTAEKIYHPK